MMKRMEYGTFKIFAVEEIKHYLPPEYADWQVKLTSMYKVNEKLDCLNVTPPKGDTFVAIPNLYLQDYYQFVESGYSADKALRLMADVITSAPDQKMLQDAGFCIEDFKENVVWMLINREKNKALLERVPHRTFLDLAIVYRVLVFSPQGHIAGALVNNGILDSWGMTEEQLFKKASVHTRRVLPLQFMNLAQVIGETAEKLASEDELEQELEAEIREMTAEGENLPFYMLTNEMRTFGAAMLLYPDALEMAAHCLKSDYYILPSSIHELLLVPTSYGTADAFRTIVKSANEQVVAPEEWLSDQIYLYEREGGTLRLT